MNSCVPDANFLLHFLHCHIAEETRFTDTREQAGHLYRLDDFSRALSVEREVRITAAAE